MIYILYKPIYIYGKKTCQLILFVRGVPLLAVPQTLFILARFAVGGDSPIAVHASTDVRVSDYRSILKQINACVDIGADIMCIPCDSIDTAKKMGDVVFPSPVTDYRRNC